MKTDIDEILQRGSEPARRLSATDDQVAEILRELTADPAPSQPRSRRISGTGLACVVLVAGVVAVSPAGAAISDVAQNFGSYLAGEGDGQTPGTAIDASDVPSGFGIAGSSDQRLLAQDGDYRLFAAQENDGAATVFAYNGASWAGGNELWQSQLADTSIFILGAPVTVRAEESGERPMYGIVADDVATVEAQYRDGGSVRADASSGGFILVLDLNRPLARLVALDQSSQPVGEVPANTYNLTKAE